MNSCKTCKFYEVNISILCKECSNCSGWKPIKEKIMKKSCQMCRFSIEHTNNGYCSEDPDNPIEVRDHCKLLSEWKPVFKPSEMDLLALESLRDGREVYSKDGKKSVVYSIEGSRNAYSMKTGVHVFFYDKIYAEKPCTDLTEEEVKEHMFEKVWMWDKDNAEEYKLVGFIEGHDYPYRTKNNHFAHASLTKPKF